MVIFFFHNALVIQLGIECLLQASLNLSKESMYSYKKQSNANNFVIVLILIKFHTSKVIFI